MISFIIPVKNDAKRLQTCLQSVVQQNVSGTDIEIIVMDNGSSDNSVEVATKMGAIVQSVPGFSVAQLRNKGALSAKGELIAFVDADHVLTNHWLLAGLDAMKEPDCGIAGAPYSIPSSATWVQRAYNRFRRHPETKMDIEWLGSGNILIRRELFLKLNGFDESLETCEDVDLCQRTRKNGWRIVANPDMESIHFGDPATLKSLFLGELWRGRNNLRVTMKGPLTMRDLVSLAVLALNLPGLALILISIIMLLCGSKIGLPVLLAGIFFILAPAILRCASMLRPNMGLFSVFETFMVAVTYNLARALALVLNFSHDTRRAAK